MSKLFPNNMAKIQLQNQTLIAKLEIPLTIGDNYHFQVQISNKTLYLKVVGNKLKNNIKTDISSLLKTLGLKSSETNRSFIYQLIANEIPFDKTQIKQALQLLENHKKSNQVHNVLKELVKRQLPLTESTFQALYAINTSKQQSRLIKNLLGELEKRNTFHSNTTSMLKELSKSLVFNNESLHHLVLSNNKKSDFQIFQFIKSLGLIDTKIDFDGWQSTWSPNEPSYQNPLASNLDLTQLRSMMEQVSNNESRLLKDALTFMQKWEKTLSNSIRNQIPMKTLPFQMITKEFSAIRDVIQFRGDLNLTNEPNNLNQARELMILLSNEEFYQSVNQKLASVYANNLLEREPKEQFFRHLRHYLMYSGLDYEYKLSQQVGSFKSLKGYLLQMLSDGTNKHAEKLLHLINGMQLNAVNESENFIYTNLYIPGEKLGLRNDMNLEFSSKKTKKGKIDPDYCRIHFYLELPRLKETMIEMNIQQRNISLIIYNNMDDIKYKTYHLQNVLKAGLEKINYHLASVKFKPLEVYSNDDNTFDDRAFRSRGVDFRV